MMNITTSEVQEFLLFCCSVGMSHIPTQCLLEIWINSQHMYMQLLLFPPVFAVSIFKMQLLEFQMVTHVCLVIECGWFQIKMQSVGWRMFVHRDDMWASVSSSLPFNATW